MQACLPARPGKLANMGFFSWNTVQCLGNFSAYQAEWHTLLKDNTVLCRIKMLAGGDVYCVLCLCFVIIWHLVTGLTAFVCVACKLRLDDKDQKTHTRFFWLRIDFKEVTTHNSMSDQSLCRQGRAVLFRGNISTEKEVIFSLFNSVMNLDLAITTFLVKDCCNLSFWR